MAVPFLGAGNTVGVGQHHICMLLLHVCVCQVTLVVSDSV